jgi:hypothetical protein
MANIELFEQLVNDKQLVLMKFHDTHTPYFKGQIAGFPPDAAARYYEQDSAHPCDIKGNPISLRGEPVQEPVQRAPRVPIPDDWESMHHLQQFKLAERIRPGETPANKQEALTWIAAELERRVNEDTD